MDRKTVEALLRDLQTRDAVREWLEALVAERAVRPSLNGIRRLRVDYGEL